MDGYGLKPQIHAAVPPSGPHHLWMFRAFLPRIGDLVRTSWNKAYVEKHGPTWDPAIEEAGTCHQVGHKSVVGIGSTWMVFDRGTTTGQIRDAFYERAEISRLSPLRWFGLKMVGAEAQHDIWLPRFGPGEPVPDGGIHVLVYTSPIFGDHFYVESVLAD